MDVTFAKSATIWGAPSVGLASVVYCACPATKSLPPTEESESETRESDLAAKLDAEDATQG